LLSDTNLKFKQSQIPEYEAATEIHGGYLRSEDSKQPGDPEKFVKIVIDLVRQEGCSQGKKIPFRLPIGADAVTEIKGKLQEVTDIMEEWDTVITRTDHQ
jgi:hypothetical protein